MILHGIELYQYGIALFLMVLHWYCMVLHGIARCCIVLYGIALYRIKSYGIASYCIVGFGARAVSRKTPIYFIFYQVYISVKQRLSSQSKHDRMGLMIIPCDEAESKLREMDSEVSH